jgi:demethylsterigmatocystin 6-O-methyltransferase
MRNIIHNYADKKAVAILKNIIPAMSKDSVILIDNMVLPDVGLPHQAANLDVTMMAVLASRERTQKQWTDLLEPAGLKINKIYTYTPAV